MLLAYPGHLLLHALLRGLRGHELGLVWDEFEFRVRDFWDVGVLENREMLLRFGFLWVMRWLLTFCCLGGLLLLRGDGAFCYNN